MLKMQTFTQLKLLKSHLLVDGFCVDDEQSFQSQRILNRVCDRLIAHTNGELDTLRLTLETLLANGQTHEPVPSGHAETNLTTVLNKITLSCSA